MTARRNQHRVALGRREGYASQDLVLQPLETMCG
jgi:hypothetical protein